MSNRVLGFPDSTCGLESVARFLANGDLYPNPHGSYIGPIPYRQTWTRSRMKSSFLIIFPAIAVGVGTFLYQFGLDSGICWTAAVATLVAGWWITEPIPIPATSLIPLAVFPIANVLTPSQVAEAYGSKLILLMLGGFLLSAAMERSGAHRRIALGMVNLFGGSSLRRLVFGFMAASAFLSMWISNAATTLMLLPIIMAIVSQTNNARLTTALLLGTAYSASIGGIGTPIGTPPNVIFMAVFQDQFGLEVGFVDWMKWAVPIAFVMLPVTAMWLTRGLAKTEPLTIPDVGSWRAEEVRTLGVFAVTAILWMTRQQPFGGWTGVAESAGFPMPLANDASVALKGALAMFLIPNGRPDGQGDKLLDWETAQKIPWGILILFAGGLCLAEAFKESGLSVLMGEGMANLGTLPTWVLIGVICLGVTFLTEVTSNTATTTLLLPILATAAIAAELEPKMVMIPATISASFAFMLPVATPPNAIVFGSGQFSVGQMAREGLVLNLIGVIIVALLCYVMFS